MTRILVTGSNGQLGKSIRKFAGYYPEFSFIFKDSAEFDVTNCVKVNELFFGEKLDYCINCAAYTNVEQAEKEPHKAFLVNAEGVKNLANSCSKNNVILIHVSTDYVFDGKKKTPYKTTDPTNPLNVYGASKLKGEEYVTGILVSYFIIRTSWLYSDYGKNFYKTILRKAKAGEQLQVTDNQTGCPTHASNLALYILNLIASGNTDFGILHYTDGVAMTWYEFAQKILEANDLGETTQLTKAENYRTFAPRPKNSVLI